jgi:hypothetical protein
METMKPRRFKLIKEYPYYEQLKNGIIIEYDNIKGIYFYQINSDKCIIFNKHEVEDFPEFWQEMKNKSMKEENERYQMCKDQNAQIDCRVEDCKYYNGAGECMNVSPAITLNETKERGKWFTCWSHKSKKKPVLITEDGKELFECDEYWYVDISFNHFNIGYSNLTNYINKKLNNWKYFSTQESAKKWIDENKPKWSDKDTISFHWYIK